MTKKLRISLILIYCLAISFLFLPFMKQALLIYRTQEVTIKTTYTSEKAAEVPLEAVQPPDMADVLAFQRNQTFQASGQLIIPKVDIGLPVFSGVTNQEILVGAGTLFPERTPENHNVVLIGHHLGKESLLFGKLLNVAIGDSIFFEDASGFYQYIVSETKIIDQTDLRVLDDHGTSEITLITCDKPTQTKQRFIVKGQLFKKPGQMTKQKIVHDKQEIIRKKKQNNRLYCIIVVVSFLFCLLVGIKIITKVSD